MHKLVFQSKKKKKEYFCIYPGITRATLKLFLHLFPESQEVPDRTQRSNLLMMDKSDVIINGKSIANLNGRIARHVMIFKSGIKDLSSCITSRAITCACMQL